MSNAVLNKALFWLLKALIGSVNWDKVREIVIRFNDSDMDDIVKRQAVYSVLRSVLMDISDSLLNLAIEAAVVYIKGMGK
jgi:hypothetical protein